MCWCLARCLSLAHSLPLSPVVDYTISISNRIGTPALGGTYSLTCTVQGVSGSPTIQWFGPGGSEITTGVSTTTLASTLTFTDLALSDAGEYTCRSTISGVVREVVETVMPQSRFLVHRLSFYCSVIPLSPSLLHLYPQFYLTSLSYLNLQVTPSMLAVY